MSVKHYIPAIAFAVACLGCLQAQAPSPQQSAATISVTGDTVTPLTLNAEDLAKLPREKASLPEPDGKTAEYEGVSLREILKRAGLPDGKVRGKALTTYVLAKAHDGYQVVFTLAEVDREFGNQQVLVADKRNGSPLPGREGPFRIICPQDKERGRSVRMLDALEVVRLHK